MDLLSRLHLLTVQDLEAMVSAKVLHEDQRIELIGGHLVEMTPIGPAHAGCVNDLTRVLWQAVPPGWIVAVQNPIVLDNLTMPCPDVMVLKPQGSSYRERHPRPEDAALLVEVSDSTLGFDRTVKLPRYASAGIAEVWIVDLTDAQVECYTEPDRAQGSYRDMLAKRSGESIAPTQLPQLTLPVDVIVTGER